MISVPGLLLKSHLHYDYVMLVVSIHLLKHAETITVFLVEALFDRKHVQDAVASVILVVVRQENTDFLFAVLVLRLDGVDPDPILNFNGRFIRFGYLNTRSGTSKSKQLANLAENGNSKL